MTLDPSHIDGDATASQGTATRAVPADWRERLIARVIDGALFVVLYYILFAVFWAVSGAEDPMAAKIGGGGAHTLLPELFAWLIAGVAFAVYDVASHSRHGRTLGKRLLRIELAPVAGGVLTTVSLAKRAALLPGPMTAMGIPALNLLAGVFLFAIGLFILIDKPLQQGLHDKVAGTWVVKRGR